MLAGHILYSLHQLPQVSSGSRRVAVHTRDAAASGGRQRREKMTQVQYTYKCHNRLTISTILHKLTKHIATYDCIYCIVIVNVNVFHVIIIMVNST